MVLPAYFVAQGIPAGEAITHLRALRLSSGESIEQESDVHAYARSRATARARRGATVCAWQPHSHRFERQATIRHHPLIANRRLSTSSAWIEPGRSACGTPRGWKRTGRRSNPRTLASGYALSKRALPLLRPTVSRFRTWCATGRGSTPAVTPSTCPHRENQTRFIWPLCPYLCPRPRPSHSSHRNPLPDAACLTTLALPQAATCIRFPTTWRSRAHAGAAAMSR